MNWVRQEPIVSIWDPKIELGHELARNWTDPIFEQSIQSAMLPQE